jgi:hypothetical protein
MSLIDSNHFNVSTMKHYFSTSLIFVLFAVFCCSQKESSKESIIKNEQKTKDTILPQEIAKYPDVKSIPVPEGYKRVDVATDSYGEYLRNLKLKTENNIVYLYDGTEKGSQSVHFAVIVMDVGKADLQQCADAVMRMRAEYLYSQKKYGEIHFNFLSDGKPRYFKDYANGDMSYNKFRNYMNYVFSYANTSSLKDELKPVASIYDIQIGDIFIQKGKPYGHAITVMDVAKNDSGEVLFLLAQSYMPAQEIHVLKNFENETISPWYKIETGYDLPTPEWYFKYEDLYRF